MFAINSPSARRSPAESERRIDKWEQEEGSGEQGLGELSRLHREQKMERLPSSLVTDEILSRLDFETLSAVACVSRAFRFSVDTQIRPFLSSLSLPSSISPDASTLESILRRCTAIKSLTLNCQRLPGPSLNVFLNNQIQELNLSSCSLFSYEVFCSFPKYCPLLRVLMLELPDEGDTTGLFLLDLSFWFCNWQHVESFCLKTRGLEADANTFWYIGTECILPKSLKVLKLKPMREEDAFRLACIPGQDEIFSMTDGIGYRLFPLSSCLTLQCLSLVLDVISDRLLIAVTNSLYFLVELELEDRPAGELSSQLDLTNNGLQLLGSLQHLTSLSLIRSRKNYRVSFTRVNDMGMFLLSESCKGLQSVTLSGFSKVSDAGFASLLHSCQNLKKFEVRNALLLSDLAFHNLIGTPCALVEVRLFSCNLITSETVKKLTLSRSLEVLDLCGCKSVADSCLRYVSCLDRLTTLNLTGADITDSGVSILGRSSAPITHLYLRGCKRVTDRGISFLLRDGGAIGRTLSALDLGYMPGISDNGILIIAADGREIIELGIRNCFHVTDSSLRALATKRRLEDGSKPLQRLDLFNCSGLSADALSLLRRPLFPRLHWLGIGNTRLARNRGPAITEILRERQSLTLCLDGCEMGCRDGWQLHGQERC